MPSDPVQAAIKSHAVSVDMVVSRFLAELDATVARAQNALSHKLLTSLALDPVTHKVLATSGNSKILRKLPQLWQNALDAAGLEGVIERYMNSFPAQIPAFRDVLDAVNHVAETPLPLPDFTASDVNYFNNLKLSAGADISALIEGAAATTIGRTAFNLGAVKFTELVKDIVDRTNTTVSRAETLANTSLQAMYRTVSARGYERIEAKTGQPLLLDWIGPDDKKTSKKCEALLVSSRKQPLTRAEIDDLKPYPGNPGPVLTFGFHYNCRHSFVASLRQGVQSA